MELHTLDRLTEGWTPAPLSWWRALRGLRGRLLALAVACVLPLILFGAWAAWAEYQRGRAAALAEAHALAVRVSAQVDDHIRHVESLLLSTGVLDIDRLDLIDVNDAKLKALQAGLPPYFNNLFLLLPDGKMVNSSTRAADDRAQLNFADRLYFQEAVRGDDLASGEPVISRFDGDWILVFARALRKPDNSVRVVVGASTRLKWIEKMLEPRGLPPGSVMTLLNDRGVVVARNLDGERWIGKDISNFAGVPQILARREGAAEVTGIDGVSRLAGYAPVGRVPWVVFVGIPSERNLAAVQANFMMLAGAGLIALLIAGALAWWLSGRLARPILELAADAGQLAQGALGHRTAVRARSEVGQLAMAFNSMAGSLDHRTRALQSSEERFRMLAETIPVAIWMMDEEARIIYLNRAGRMFFGLNEGQGVNMDVAELVHPEDRERYLVALKTVFPERQLGNVTCRMRRHDRAYRWVLGSGGPRYDFRGEFIGYLGSGIDITEQRQTEQELLLTQVAVDRAQDMIVLTDREGRVRRVNHSASELLGYSRDALLRMQLSDFVLDYSRERLAEEWRRLTARGQFTLEITLITRAGRQVPVEAVANHMQFGGKEYAFVLVRDMSERKRSEERIRYLASHDALTGLMNRHEFESRLKQLLDGPAQKAVLLHLDLDQFKAINETCGYMAGDELLREIALAMSQHVGEWDTVARLSADQFAALLECTEEQATGVAERLRLAVAGHRFLCQGKPYALSASLGLVALRKGGLAGGARSSKNIAGEKNSGEGIAGESVSGAELLTVADAACSIAKERGGNRIHWLAPGDAELKARRGEMAWANRIKQALEQDRFCLYYQDILPLAPGGTAHREILVRMTDGAGGLILPTAFIPAAERYNLMPAIDRWVIGTALAHWPRIVHRAACHAVDGAADGTMDGAAIRRPAATINLSGASLSDDSLLAFVREQLAAHGVPAQSVCFEITETAAVANLAKASQLVREFKALGCSFALDDFGSGMSSFGYLKNLPVDFLKIDGSFVRDMHFDPVSRAMVEAINNVGHVMGLKTIAEYVENEAILAALRDLGIDYAQGYGIARPQPLLDAVAGHRGVL